MIIFKSVITTILDLFVKILKKIVILFFQSQYIKYQDKANIINDKFEELMDFKELITSKGFQFEEHKVTTDDGYILTLHRVSYNKLSKSKKIKKSCKRKNLKEINEDNKFNRQPILMIHGIFDSSEGWVCNDEDKCIPLILAKLGYDVWLGNSRGNKYSRDHVNLNVKKTPNDPLEEKNLKAEFWNFSFEEMGKYDLPAFIDHILEINKKSKKIIYIGHSQGTTQLFSGLAQNKEYFEKNVKLFLALAPVAKTKHLDSLLYSFFDLIKLDYITEKLGFKEIFPFNKEVQIIFSYLFKKFPILPSIATEIIGDKNSILFNNYKRLSVLFSHLPSGSSLRALNHLVQMFRSDKFCKFDFGKEKNLIEYGTEIPPEFNLDMVKNIPIALFGAKNDRLAHPKDVDWLNNKLKHTIVFTKTFDDMGHLSFLISQDFKWFENALKLIKEYSD